MHISFPHSRQEHQFPNCTFPIIFKKKEREENDQTKWYGTLAEVNLLLRNASTLMHVGIIQT